MPRNPDGSLPTQQLLKSPCDFVCPSNPSICLPKHLVCNGIVNCPNASKANSSEINTMETLITNIEESLQTYGIFNLKNAHTLNDESPEVCRNVGGFEHDVDYYDEHKNVKWALIVAGSCFVVVMFIAVLCKMCKRRTKNQ